MTTALRGQVIRFAGDPFAEGDGVLVHESDGAVVFDGGRIAAVGPAEAVLGAHPDASVEDVRPALIVPGFVDCHVHYPQIGVVASYGAQLLDWLERYTFPEEMRFGDAEVAEAAARAFFATQIANGFTTSAAFCTTHPGSVAAFFAEATRLGVRAVGGKVMMDRNAPSGLCDDAVRGHDESAALIDRWHGTGRCTYAITPRFAPTSSPGQLEAAGALWAAHPTALMQSHLCETEAEIAWVRSLFPEARDYTDVYDRFGLLGPGALFGHGIHLTARERVRLAEAGAGIAHCPTSNQFLGSGACDVTGLKANGVSVGLATDTGGGSSFSPFATMRAAYEVGQRRGVALSAARLWWLATAGSAAALRLGGVVGALVPGCDGDAVVIDPAAHPVLGPRAARAEDIAGLLFATAILGDDRIVAQVWSGGLRVH